MALDGLTLTCTIAVCFSNKNQKWSMYLCYCDLFQAKTLPEIKIKFVLLNIILMFFYLFFVYLLVWGFFVLVSFNAICPQCITLL